MNENLNLADILKDCPRGTKFYTTVWGEVSFRNILKDSIYAFSIDTCSGNECITKKGCYIPVDDAECIIFPSKTQRNWDKFEAPWYNKEPEPKFKVGDWLCANELNNYANLIKIVKIVDVFGKKRYKISRDYDSDLDLTEFDFIEKYYHLWDIQDAKDGDVLAISWLEDKNLWEKIIIFKKYLSEFVEGYGNTFKNGKMAFIDEEVPYYSKTWPCNLHPATKEQRDLLFQKIKESGYKWNSETKSLENFVEPKFNPKTLKPFDRVLTRDSNSEKWHCNYFSYIDYGDIYFPYATSGGAGFAYCIPYNEDTQHLVGTCNEPADYYKYWED